MFDDEIGTKENKHLTKAKSQPQLFGVTWSKVDIFNVLSVSLWKRSLYERRTMSTQIKTNTYLFDCQPGFCGTHWEKLDVYWIT